jgi:DNA repair protein RadA/Sms
MVGVPAPTPLHLEGGATFGRAICPVVEGNRPILVEVQALVSKAAYGSGRRVAVGVPDRRVAVLLAVLERYADIDLSSHDVYVQVSSGISVAEPAIDAAICAAIASSYWSSPADPHPVDAACALVGEVALGGELRPVRGMDSRAKEVARQGFTRLIGPANGPKVVDLVYQPVTNIKDLLATLNLLVPAGAKPVEGGKTRAGSFWGKSRRSGAGSGEEADET